MQSWKQAYWLAKFELKHSKINLLFNIGILIIILFLVVPIIPEYFEESSLGLDLLFLFVFTVIFHFMRPKVFQQQEVSGYFYASHFLISLNQLAIDKEVIIKYRFLIYVIISVPFQLLFLSSLYVLAPILQEQMSISSYLAFAFIWLCISLLGTSQIVYEAGNHFVSTIVFSLLFGIISVIFGIILFYKVYTGGFVNWTIYIANQYPILASTLSILLAIFSWHFGMKRMRRKMDTYDYFI